MRRTQGGIYDLLSHTQLQHLSMVLQEEFEDTKGAMRIRISVHEAGTNIMFLRYLKMLIATNSTSLFGFLKMIANIRTKK